MRSFSLERRRFLKEFGTTAPLLALYNPLWSTEDNTYDLQRCLKRYLLLLLVPSTSLENIVMVILDHHEYKEQLGLWTILRSIVWSGSTLVPCRSQNSDAHTICSQTALTVCSLLAIVPVLCFFYLSTLIAI